jgi:hypothetical protein
MGRAHNQKARDKNKQTLPQLPKNMKSDGKDIEFANELADQEDLEAMARANAAGIRVSNARKKG